MKNGLFDRIQTIFEFYCEFFFKLIPQSVTRQWVRVTAACRIIMQSAIFAFIFFLQNLLLSNSNGSIENDGILNICYYCTRDVSETKRWKRATIKWMLSLFRICDHFECDRPLLNAIKAIYSGCCLHKKYI